jgi:hypothetical protein
MSAAKLSLASSSSGPPQCLPKSFNIDPGVTPPAARGHRSREPGWRPGRATSRIGVLARTNLCVTSARGQVVFGGSHRVSPWNRSSAPVRGALAGKGPRPSTTQGVRTSHAASAKAKRPRRQIRRIGMIAHGSTRAWLEQARGRCRVVRYSGSRGKRTLRLAGNFMRDDGPHFD